MRFFEYKHIVGFEETNLVGNVYFANHVRWQGSCREMFLREHAPSVLRDLENGLALVTIFVSCEYLNEVRAFDEITIRMRLEEMSQNRVTMSFEYWRTENGRQGEIVARGRQQIACMQRQNRNLIPISIPRDMEEALRSYTS